MTQEKTCIYAIPADETTWPADILKQVTKLNEVNVDYEANFSFNRHVGIEVAFFERDMSGCIHVASIPSYEKEMGYATIIWIIDNLLKGNSFRLPTEDDLFN